MKRIVLFIVVFVLVAIVPLLIWGEGFTSFSEREKAVTSIILALLELFGVVFAFFVLYQYIQYRRPRRFVFEGFKNADALATAQKKPIDLNNLAREELVSQFQLISTQLQEYVDRWHSEFESVSDSPFQSSKPREASSSQKSCKEDLFTDESTCKEDITISDIPWYLPSLGVARHNLNVPVFNFLIRSLQQIIDSFGRDVPNLVSIVGGTTPKEIALIMRFIDAVIPPHIIKAIGHLQWRDDVPERAGITIETVDLGNQSSFMIRTIWQPSDENIPSADPRLAAPLNVATEPSTNVTIANRKENESPDEDEGPMSRRSLIESYIELLRPTMRWLVLVFWEQKITSSIARTNFVTFEGKEEKLTYAQVRAGLLYLLGSLYYASAGQFPRYKRFFCQLASEHLRQAADADPDWFLPRLYLANICSIEMRKVPKTEKNVREKLLGEALSSYNEVLDCAREEEGDIQNRIKICQAIAKLASDDGRLIDEAKKEVLDVILRTDLSSFDTTAEVCAVYLYDLACWFGIANEKKVGITDARQLARRYLAYSLARSQRLWAGVRTDLDLKSICDERDLKALKEELGKKLKEEPKLASLRGEKFETLINEVLDNIGWCGTWYDAAWGGPTFVALPHL